MKRIIEIEEKDLDRIREIVERENKTALSVTTRGTAYIAIADSRLYEERPQDESVDMSKLRLMTVEECAGHTIEYAMGWKACIEWIKKGGVE